ncbi:MAG: magnesium transporter CorA family protein [Chloroflexota bacterium]
MDGFGSGRRRHHGRPEGPVVIHAWSAAGGLVSLDGPDAIAAAAADPAVRLWVDLEDASEETLLRVGAALGIHELVLEDMAHRNQRAKVEHTDGTMHLVLFALTYANRVHAHEIDIVVGERFLVSSHPPGWRPAETIDLARRGIDHYLSEGTDFLLYAIVDPIVDGYFPLMDHLSDEIDSLEDQVVTQPSRPVLERLFRIRRELLRVRHTVSPEREILNQLTNRENPLIAPDRILYFRDVYDHLIRVTDELDTHRELVSGALEAYLSTVNNGLSDVMKRLTAVTAVLAGIGAVAGIFGMSEAGSALSLHQEPGFWLVAACVALVGASVFLYFRHIDWI